FFSASATNGGNRFDSLQVEVDSALALDVIGAPFQFLKGEEATATLVATNVAARTIAPFVLTGEVSGGYPGSARVLRAPTCNILTHDAFPSAAGCAEGALAAGQTVTETVVFTASRVSSYSVEARAQGPNTGDVTFAFATGAVMAPIAIAVNAPTPQAG